jgi:hypothetical protein
MFRYQLVFLWGLSVAGHAAASSWTEKLFEQVHQDFGVVPQGQTLTHSFPIVNRTGKPIHVADVRVSCGCTAARALQNDLAPGSKSAILAQMDTRRFAGKKTVTIFVRFDCPQCEETRLSVTANSRKDITVSPESLSFGRVQRGSSPTVPLAVEVKPALSVSPHVADFGQVGIGVEAERKVLIRSNRPFRITGVEPADAALRCHYNPSEAKRVHVLRIQYKPVQPGVLEKNLSISTDMSEKAKLVVRASAGTG